MMKRNFQTLVVFHQFLIFGTLVMQSVTDSWMPPEVRGALGIESSVMEDTADVASSGQMARTLWWGVTLISVLASVGVVLFRRWGRTLFVLASALSLLLTPFGGLYVDVGLTVLVGTAACVVEGMIISLMFFSPLRRLFKSVGEI
jgi:hypothetical protein